jgi:hypothetical protein
LPAARFFLRLSWIRSRLIASSIYANAAMAVNTVLAHRSAGVDVAAVEVQDTEIDAPSAQLVGDADHTTASLTEGPLSAFVDQPVGAALTALN